MAKCVAIETSEEVSSVYALAVASLRQGVYSPKLSTGPGHGGHSQCVHSMKTKGRKNAVEGRASVHSQQAMHCTTPRGITSIANSDEINKQNGINRINENESMELQKLY